MVSGGGASRGAPRRITEKKEFIRKVVNTTDRQKRQHGKVSEERTQLPWHESVSIPSVDGYAQEPPARLPVSRQLTGK